MPPAHRKDDDDSRPVVRSVPGSVLWGLLAAILVPGVAQALITWQQVGRMADNLQRLEAQYAGVSVKLDEINRTNSVAAQKDSTHDAQILNLSNRMTQLEGMFPRTVPPQLMPVPTR